MFTYKYKDEFGNEITIDISHEVHKIVEDESKFERRIKNEYKNHITNLTDGQYEALPSLVDIEESVIMREGLRDIFAIVNNCTQKQRRRFMFHVVHGLTLDEIAQIEGCSPQGVWLSIKQVSDRIMNSL